MRLRMVGTIREFVTRSASMAFQKTTGSNTGAMTAVMPQ
jgi:hypothetical protein